MARGGQEEEVWETVADRGADWGEATADLGKNTGEAAADTGVVWREAAADLYQNSGETITELLEGCC